MTAYRYCELRCDRPSCGARYGVGEARADATRASAAHSGWVHGPGILVLGSRMRALDFCRDHAHDLRPPPITDCEARVLRAVHADGRVTLAGEDGVVAEGLIVLDILEWDDAGALALTSVGALVYERLDPPPTETATPGSATVLPS